MTADRAHLAGSERPRAPALDSVPELSRVKLRSAERTRDGRVVPADAAGTVVEVLAKGDAYMVEFVEPFHALLTLEARRLDPVVRAGD